MFAIGGCFGRGCSALGPASAPWTASGASGVLRPPPLTPTDAAPPAQAASQPARRGQSQSRRRAAQDISAFRRPLTNAQGREVGGRLLLPSSLVKASGTRLELSDGRRRAGGGCERDALPGEQNTRAFRGKGKGGGRRPAGSAVRGPGAGIQALARCARCHLARGKRRHPKASSRPAGPNDCPFPAALGAAELVRRAPEYTMEQEKYLPELMAEKDSLDPSFVHAMRLLAEGKTLPGFPDAGSPWLPS